MKAPSPQDVRERYTERLWQVAHCFHTEGSQEASDFVEQRLSRILEGDVELVIGGFQQMATKQGLRGSLRAQLRKAVAYLSTTVRK